MIILIWLGFARFEWFRKWTGGTWYLGVFNNHHFEWCRPQEFNSIPTVEKRIAVTEVWGG